MSDAIREAREAKGLSKSKLARKLGVSMTTIQQWEKGETAPKRGRWPAITKELGLSLRDLALNGTKEAFSAEEPALPYASTRGEREWLELYRQLADPCRRAAVHLLKKCIKTLLPLVIFVSYSADYI